MVRNKIPMRTKVNVVNTSARNNFLVSKLDKDIFPV